MGGGGYIGGGGGGYGGTEDIEELEGVARGELERGERPARRRVFLSFIHTDEDKVNFLRMQAKNEKSDLDFIDMGLRVPFNSENAEYIKGGIRARIRQSSVTVVMVSDDTHKSDWVNWEVEESLKSGKGVVVVDVRKNSQARMPNAVNDNRGEIKVVPWKHEAIMRAVDEAAENR